MELYLKQGIQDYERIWYRRAWEWLYDFWEFGESIFDPHSVNIVLNAI